MVDENKVWEDLTPSIELAEENFFQEWASFENRFGEFGNPGFTEYILPARFPGIFGHNETVDVRFTVYRGNNGQLLAVHGCYIDEYDNGLQKPFILDVHPDYQRQGIGTMFMNYVTNRYFTERGSEYTYEDSLRNVTYTEASANFANKFVKNNYSALKNNSES